MRQKIKLKKGKYISCEIDKSKDFFLFTGPSALQPSLLLFSVPPSLLSREKEGGRRGCFSSSSSSSFPKQLESSVRSGRGEYWKEEFIAVDLLLSGK